jgi:sugar lactone lactonase YvrE
MMISGSRTRITAADGLIDGRVTTSLKGKDGSLWVAGQHLGKSGAARNDGTNWRVFSTQDGLAGEGIHNGHVASNGDIWFGTKWASGGSAGAGAIRFDGGNWRVYTTKDGLIHDQVYDIVETADGAIWFGTLGGVSRFDPGLERVGTIPRPDGQVAWTSFTPGGETPESQKARTLCVAQDGSVWVGYGINSRGVSRYDGSKWKRYTTEDGLGGNIVHGISETREGVLWFGTDGGLTRFDGENWTTFATETIPIPFPTAFNTITEGPGNALWVAGSPQSGQIGAFVPDKNRPQTRIESVPDRISSAGHVFLKWSGADLWEETPRKDLHYRWRLDDNDWSRWSNRTDVTLTSLDSGPHTIEVQASDASMNVDATPAVHAFVVEAPWWRNPVVAGPGLLIIAFALFQTARVVQAKRKLQDSVDALSSANNELFQVNVDLQREQVLERLRGQAQGMQSSEDIGPVAEAVYRELTEIGLPLIRSGIRVFLSDKEAELWFTDTDGLLLEPIVVERGQQNMESGPHQARLRGEDYYHIRRDGPKLKDFLGEQIAMGNPVWRGFQENRWPQRLDIYNVFFDEGAISLHTEEPVSEEHLMLIKRFGEVFGYAHSRHRELQEKEAQNRRLAVEASVQRLRAEVQSMDEASDFERILSLLTESLKTVELSFDGCEIDVLDDPSTSSHSTSSGQAGQDREDPTMAHFEANGFQYTTFRLDPNGNVTSNSHNLAAPFPSVIEQTVERFIAGEPWQGLSDDLRIVEVPAGSYGRLRLTATNREQFTDDETATLREFADAVALGYARYLDIREIQEATVRKSAFLASMSHELRTPMNAIKGFTNIVLRRGKDQPWERNEENLTKVSQASDHLLTMINDLLDLSKIEAGRMDVNATAFDVRELAASACDTVSPLIQEGVELRQDVADDIGEANTDKAWVQQMVINLLSNAIKFTDSGIVTVTAQSEQAEVSRQKENLVIASSGSPVRGSRFSSFLFLTRERAFPWRSSRPSSTNTVRLKDRRAAYRRGPAWGCRLRRSSRSCWAGRSGLRAKWGKAVRLPCVSRQITKVDR